MVKALTDYGPHVIVRKEIIYCFALAAAGDKVALLKHLKLVRYCRLRHTEQLCNGAHAHFGFKKRKQNAHTRGIAEQLEQIRKVAQHFLARQLVPH